MNTTLTVEERESLTRLITAFEAEERTAPRSSLAALYSDLRRELAGLRDNEPEGQT